MDVKGTVKESFQKIASIQIQQKGPEKETASTTSSTVKDQFDGSLKTGPSLFDLPKINDGIDGGHIRPQVPGGNDRNQNEPSAMTRKLPEGETPSQSADKNKDLQSKNGELVHPKDFTKENQLRNLLNPWKEVKQDGPTSKPTAGVGEKNPNNVLNNMGKDPSISDGKNHSSRRSESSSEAGSSTKAPSPGQAGFIGPLTEDQTKALERAKIEREKPIAPEPKQSGSPNSGVWCAKFSTGVRGTPNPENDSGDGHAPAIVMQKRTPKTIGQLEQEKRRQITLPGEGRSNQEVHADQKETLQEGQRHRTNGRIDPAPNDDGTTTSTGPRTVKPGFGTERVDGRPGHKPGSGLTTPGQPAPSSGTTPDNPTADDPSDDDSDRNAA